MIESLSLAIMRAALGLLLARRGLHLMIALRPADLDVLDAVHLDPVAIYWTLGLSVAPGLAFGLAPALFATEGGMGEILKRGARSIAGQARSRRIRGARVAAEVALSMGLLVGAGLPIRTIRAMQHVDPGFDPHSLTTVNVSLPEHGDTTPATRAALQDRLVAQVQLAPGVRAVSAAMGAPPHPRIALLAIAASYIPARRATRVDPLIALRAE